jgi:hypothetical protein
MLKPPEFREARRSLADRNAMDASRLEQLLDYTAYLSNN